MTWDTLVKVEQKVQHITRVQLRGTRDRLGTNYDELLK